MASSFIVPMIEPIPIQDTFVLGIGAIEILGPCARFVLYSEQTSAAETAPENIIVCKIVIPIDAVPDCINFTVRTLAAKWTREVVKRYVRLV